MDGTAIAEFSNQFFTILRVLQPTSVEAVFLGILSKGR
jgi:hypothetical protein